VLRPYRDVLSVPGAAFFASTGVIARLPISMLGIGIVLLVEEATGSYGIAGAVAATYGVAQSITTPLLARAVDRFGQARTMRPAIAAHVLALVLLVALAGLSAPVWTLFVAAAVSGATIGSLGSLVRARWSYALENDARRDARLHTAYSLESVLDEVVFIAGPLLVTVLAVRFSPTLGLLAAAVAVGGGGTALLAQRSTEPPVSGNRPSVGTGVLRAPGMVVLALTFVCVGGIFGSVEVVTVAFTDERGAPGAAGWVLAAFALGSLIAGIAYGAVHWRSATGPRFVLAVLLLAVGVAPVSLVDGIWMLTGVVFVAGFAISPMLISGNQLVQDLVAPSRLTEGLSWVATALGVGVSAGSALSGAVVDAADASTAYLVPAAAGLTATAVVLLGRRWLQQTKTLVDAG
jgi:predicted MFS family arabinose efflux permease